MERKYVYKNRQSKLFIWLASIVFTLYIINELLFNNEKGLSNSFYLVFLGIVFLIQYLLYKQWYIKMDKDTIFIRKNNLFTIRKIPFSEIMDQRVLVTGDLELTLENEKVEILKDALEEKDFQEIKDSLIKITQ